MEIKTNIVVNLQIEGLHQWPLAGTIPGTEEVEFLKDLHRHMWHITLKKQVTHSDRDVEFIIFKRDVQEYLYKTYYDSNLRTHNFGSKSCEMISHELLSEFDCNYVSVFEDGENGAESMI